MTTDDEAGRKANAKNLHKQIEGLVHGVQSIPASQESPTETTSAPASASRQESPREFTQRRMRELKDQEGGS